MTEQVQEQAQAQPAQLNINDVQAAATVIDMAVKRGAFGAGEVAAIGNLYNKLNAFANAVVAAQQQTAEADPSDDGESTGEQE